MIKLDNKQKIIAVIMAGLLLGSTYGSFKYAEMKYNERVDILTTSYTEKLKNEIEKKENAQKELNELKEEIKRSKKIEEKYKNNYKNKNLSVYEIYTEKEMNEWIKERAPKNSPFINKGDVFLEVSEKTNLDPKYLVAHAALESAWGTSSIAENKNNYFGIGAYNSTPTESSYEFEADSLEESIEEGAEWINKNYIKEGKNTLNKMNSGEDAYCTLDDEVTPDSKWQEKIENIVY